MEPGFKRLEAFERGFLFGFGECTWRSRVLIAGSIAVVMTHF